MSGQSVLPPHRDSAGVYLCNAADNCVAVAVVQWAALSPTDDDPARTVPVFACADHEGA